MQPGNEEWWCRGGETSGYEGEFFNNNNQAFYSQASWGRLELKPHEQKTGTKQE
jgi:hypothetical protein